MLNLECRPLRIEKLQDSNGNDLDLCYTVGDVFSDKASYNLESIVRVVQISAVRESSLPPESGLRPQILALTRNKRPALEDPSHESDVSGVPKHAKGGLPTPGRAKRPRTDDFLVLDSMDEAEVAGDTKVRDWDGRNGLPQSGSSGEEEEEEDEEDDNESFKDALMGEAPAHSGGRISPSLGHHTPEAEPTLPAPTPALVRRSPSLRVTGVKVLPPGRRTEFSEVKEEISSSPFLKMSELAKHNSSPKVNRVPGTEVSTISGQNKHPSSSLRRRSHESPTQARSGTTRGSSASKHSVYSASESSDDDSSFAQGSKANLPRKRRSKSKSSTISETATSEADDESSQMEAAHKLQKEQEEQERENLIREAEKQKQAEKEKRESEALASEIEAQAKREQQEAREREARQRGSKETRERTAKATEEQDRIEKERLEKERLELERSKQEAAASTKSAVEKTAREVAAKAQQNSSQKKASLPGPTKEATRDTTHELRLARRRENHARLKAEREAAAKELKEIERQKSLGEVGPEKNPALVEQGTEAGNNQESTAEKTSQSKPRVRSKSGKTMDELRAEREAKAKAKELEKKEKQEQQKVDREEKKRAQQEEKERKAREKKEVQEKAKKIRHDQELMEALTQGKDSQGKESQSSSNESETQLPPILNSALKRKDPSTSAVKKPTHVSFADQNPTSSVPPVSSPTPRVMKKTPILPPGYIPPASQQSETPTAPEQVKPPAVVTTSMPPPTTNGTAQIPLKSKTVKQKESKGAGSSGSLETAVGSQLKGGKSPQTKAAPAKKPESKKPVQSKPEPESDSKSGSETELETASESDPESVDSVREATQATPTPGSKAVKAPAMTKNLDVAAPLPGTQKPKSKPTPPSSAQATASKRKAKSAVTRYEELTDSSSSSEEKEVTSSSSSLLPPTSAQRPKPSPPSESDSDTDTETDIESEDENPTNTPAPMVLIKHPPPASSQLGGSQRYKSLTDMEKDPIPDVRDVHQAARAATVAAGNKRSSGSNSSHARKRQEVAEQEASDDSDGSSDDSDDSEEEPEAKKDALAGKRASVPKKSGFGFRLV